MDKLPKPGFALNSQGAFAYDVQIEGFEQVRERLRSLADNRTRLKVLRGGVGAMLRVFRGGMRRELPYRTGTLRASVKTSSRGWQQRMEVSGRVYVGNRKAGGSAKGAKGAARGAFYAHMLEGGTKPHAIHAKPGAMLKFGNLYRRSVKHPGIRPMYTWRYVRHQEEPAAQRAFRAYVDQRIDAIWATARLPAA
jgi:hypothetical protein